MNTKRTVIAAAVGSLMALGAVQSVLAADDANTEKCYGIAKAGKNDCAGTPHSCQGQSKVDRDANDWIKVPKGTCDRIAGGSTSAPAKK
jgi:uncharacterized membrane protein